MTYESGLLNGADKARRPRLLALRASGGSSAQLGWSLVAGNGRQMARSATLYRSGAELLDSLRELRADRHALRCLLSQRQGRSWLWTAHLPARRSGEREGAAVACGARTYLRQDQCRKGMAGFLAALDQLPDEAWGLVLPVDPKW